MGQQTVSPLTPQSRPAAPLAAASTLFESTSDSIRVQVPDDWIIQDVDNAGPAQLDEEVRQGYGILMQLCPEEQAATASPASSAGASSTNTISSINASRCLGAQEVIHIIRYPDLDSRLSANNSLLTTTIDNVLTYHLQKLQEVGYRSMLIENSTDTAINIINPQTNVTITTVPAKLVEMTYSTNFAPNEMKRGYFILTSASETVPNVGTTKGYSVFYEGNSIGTGITATTSAASSSLQPTPLPIAVKQTFDSFELIAVPEATQSVVQSEQGGSEVGQIVQAQCDPSYPDICIPPPPPSLNCEDVGFLSFRVLSPDPHGFDGDNDGIGCELQGDSGNDGDVVGDGDEDEDDEEAEDNDDEDNSCHPSYPDVCIASPPPNLNCDDIDARNFEVSGSDPHGFDGDNDGIGCESGSDIPDDGSGDEGDGGDGIDDMFGGFDNDQMDGGDGNDNMQGERGDDVMEGSSGDDAMLGSFGDDDMFGGDGNDTMQGDIDRDLMFGNEGDDIMDGGSEDDLMVGGSASSAVGQGGNNIMQGGDGDDILNGAGGNDLMNGGNGNDGIGASGGSDDINGDAGNDFLNSRDGVVNNDSLDGGPDTDTCLSDPDPEVNCELPP
jgi:hypothetical protein